MPHFLVTSDKRPNAAQAQHLRKVLREIDPELQLFTNGLAYPCYILAPDEYAKSFHNIRCNMRKTDAIRAFHVALPPPA